MRFNLTIVLCGLLLVICITDQLSSVTGHSLKSAAARRAKNGGKRTENLKEEIMNKIGDERRQQKKSINHVRSSTHRTISARLHHSIAPAADEVRASGLATRDNKLHVAYDRPAAVEIYDESTYSLQRRQNVTGVGCINDMASCPDCDVVFIANRCNKMIHVIDDVGHLRTQWSVGSTPLAVAVNSQSNVIVTFVNANKLREYTPSGELVREISLPSDILHPWHAIQLDNDRIVVTGSEDYSLYRVCIINGNGAIVQCYEGSGAGQLSDPVHLALFGESLLVADHFNHRVLQLDVSSLTYIGELVNTSSEGCRPAKLAVNEDDARLYVAGYSDAGNCPINVYNLITE